MKKTLQLIVVFITTLTLHAQQIGEQVTSGTMTYTITNDNPLEVECNGFTDPTADAVANVVIPETIIPIPEVPELEFTVTGIGANAFTGNATIETVTLPSTVKIIGNEAFYNCANIETINLENVVTIGTMSFRNTKKLEHIDLSSVESIGHQSFRFASDGALKTINLGTSVGFAGSHHFHDCHVLTGVQVNWTNAQEIATLGANIFLSGTTVNHVTDLYVPVGTSSLYAGTDWDTDYFNIIEGTLPVPFDSEEFTDGDYTFETVSETEATITGTANAALTSVVIPATASNGGVTYNVVTMAASAFESNAVITDVTFNDVITDIPFNAFVACTALTTVNNTESVVTIDNYAFNGCTSLTSINTENVTSIGVNAFRQTKITSLDLGEVTYLEANALGRMYDLTGTIDLPKIENVGAYAFVYAQGVTEINFGSSLTTVDANSFFGLPSLTKISIATETPPATGDETFVFNPGIKNDIETDPDKDTAQDLTDVKLHVPNSALSAYQAANGWKDFMVETLSIDDIKAGTLVINVTSDAITVNSSSAFTDATVSVYDITGRLLASKSVNGATGSVNISNLASGIYIVKVAEGGAELVKRFAK